MTNREKIVLSAYTGILMCRFSDLHEYADKLLGETLYTQDFVDKIICERIKIFSKPEFLKIIAK